ncbi:hypothetical protein J2Y41_004674 [Arthrobacter sp. 1088]|nr:hypothetical protein [Arthrobacter sp. 1088]
MLSVSLGQGLAVQFTRARPRLMPGLIYGTVCHGLHRVLHLWSRYAERWPATARSSSASELVGTQAQAFPTKGQTRANKI